MNIYAKGLTKCDAENGWSNEENQQSVNWERWHHYKAIERRLYRFEANKNDDVNVYAVSGVLPMLKEYRNMVA